MMTDTVTFHGIGHGSAMIDSLKNNRNLRKKRKRSFDKNSTDDYDGSRPLKFKKKKRNRSELRELKLEMIRYRRRNTIIQLVIFSTALFITIALFRYLFF